VRHMSCADCGEVVPQLKPAAPAAPAAPPAANQSQDQQKNHGPNKGVQYLRNYSQPKMNTKPRQQPIADERADQTDQQITDQPKSATLHHPAGQPSRNNSNDDDNQKTLIRQVHDVAPETTQPSLMLIHDIGSNGNSAVVAPAITNRIRIVGQSADFTLLWAGSRRPTQDNIAENGGFRLLRHRIAKMRAAFGTGLPAKFHFLPQSPCDRPFFPARLCHIGGPTTTPPNG
jgi:hypothetical protein